MLTTCHADAFLQAILEEPEEPAHRLVFADWLEDDGGPENTARAELIRLQLALTDMADDDPRRPAAAARERGLLQRHGADWAGPAARLARQYEFRRGFVERVRLDAAAFLDHAAALCRQAPIRELELDVGRDALQELAGERRLERRAGSIPGLESPEAATLSDLLSRPAAARLTALRVRGVRGAAAALAAAPDLARLVCLDLIGNGLGPDDLAHLVRSARLPTLRSLLLGGNGVGSAGLQALVRSPVLGQLHALDLRANQIGPGGVGDLAGAATPLRLGTLWLGFNDLGDTGGRALAESAAVRSLTRLYLGSNRLDGAVRALALSPHLAGLTHLDLDYNPLSAAALQALAAAPGLNSLQALFLRCGRELTPAVKKRLVARFGEAVCRF
jgi:uncharacterized protein (TIGR02996 family)